MIDWPAKAPAEVADYAFDWARSLDAGETIVSRTVTPDGVTVDSSAIDGSRVRVWLSGGTEGVVATVTCRITTSGGRTFEEVAVLPIGSAAIGLAEAKKHLRVEHDDQDEVIKALLAAALEHVEQRTGKVMSPKIVTQALAGFPANGLIRLWRGPVREVVAIDYEDSAGVAQVLADYRLSEGESAAIGPLAGASFPVALAAPGSVRVRTLAGYAPEELPRPLKAAALLKLRQLFDGSDGSEDSNGEPRGFEALIRPYCPVGVG